jgi:hypothetical protein
MRRLVALAQQGPPWLLPGIALALFIHKYFLSSNTCSNQTVRGKAGANRPTRKIKRSKAHKRPQQADVTVAVQVDAQEQLAEAVLGRDKMYEWFTEDEVEALHQAQANPDAFLSLIQQ